MILLRCLTQENKLILRFLTSIMSQIMEDFVTNYGIHGSLLKKKLFNKVVIDGESSSSYFLVYHN